MWHPDTSRGREAQKIAPWALQYLDGRGFDIGCGDQKVASWASGVDLHVSADMHGDGRALRTVASGSLDFIFSSHFIEHCEDYSAVLAEWWRCIRVGGHLVLYWPHPDHYPRIGQFGANPDHKHDITPEAMRAAMFRASAVTGHGWDQVENETRSGGNEYSQFAVFRKRDDLGCEGGGFVRNPKGAKRAIVIRFGAIGDIIAATSVLAGLKADGFHVTFACSKAGRELVEHDPFIDEFITFPHEDALWHSDRMVAERFDKVVNLTNTFEVGVLAAAGSAVARWPASARRKVMAIDYLTLMTCVAEQSSIGYPRFHATDDEEMRARILTGSGPTIAWAIRGSGPQKWWPWVHGALVRLLLARHDLRVVLLAGPEEKATGDKIIERVRQFAGPEAAARVTNGAGRFSIRQSLAVMNECHVAVGVETGLMWPVARMQKPKVLLCSHSDPRQFQSWVNTRALHSRPSCGPCLRMIPDWSHCHRVEETQAAKCATDLTPEAVIEAIEAGLDQTQTRQENAA